ncbi:MAG TPA: VOC family protein [Chitinophagaceae bacterium]|jgi:PhnB protein|nr:VOC family protein [Chitinophagaceae bacterium]
MNKNSYIAEGYNAVTPSLAFKGTSEAIEWYKNVFGAKEKMRMEGPDKKVMHAELTIGDSIIFLAEEDPQYNNKSPKTLGGNSMKLYVYTPDVDATIKKAEENRAKLIKPAEDQFYGDRCGLIEDPFGYEWSIATHVRDVSEKEMKKAMEEMAHQHA